MEQQFYCYFCTIACDSKEKELYTERNYDYCQQYKCTNYFCRSCQRIQLQNAKRKVLHYAEIDNAICFKCVKKCDLLNEQQNQ